MGFCVCGEAGKGFAGFEGFAVFGCEAVLVDGFDMSFGAVADVFIELVFWILGANVYHVVVAGNFSDDGGGGDGLELGIGFDTCGDILFE